MVGASGTAEEGRGREVENSEAGRGVKQVHLIQRELKNSVGEKK
jgi:hypothetical protein